TRHPGEYQPVVVTRRAGDAVAVAIVLELRPPGNLAGALAESDEAAVQLTREDQVFAGGDPAIVPTAARSMVNLRPLACQVRGFGSRISRRLPGCYRRLRTGRHYRWRTFRR